MKAFQRNGLLLVMVAALGCGACGVGPTTFTHPNYNFGFIERVAVLPFEDLSSDRGAGARMSRYFVSELLEAEVFDIVEPGEVSNQLVKLGALGVSELTPELIVGLGRDLRAEALFFGTVTESASVRSGSTTESVITINVRLVETETGSVVWSTTLTETGRGFWSGLFGTNGATMGEVSRRAAASAVSELVN